MTICLKNINGVPTPAPDRYEDENNVIPGFNQNVELMLEKGYKPYDENDYALYLSGAKLFENDEFVDNETEEYKANQLVKAKEQKINELLSALNEKANSLMSTITINLPATLKKGEEVKNVTSYKLLTNTSGGNILQALQILDRMPPALLTDKLVTDDGYTIVGLSQEITFSGITEKQIYLILITAVRVQGQVTEYFRDTKKSILNCGSIENLNAIEISFEEF